MVNPMTVPWFMPEGLKVPTVLSPPCPEEGTDVNDFVCRLMLGIDTNDPGLSDSALSSDANWELCIRPLKSLEEINE
jgi:hypothetical protein